MSLQHQEVAALAQVEKYRAQVELMRRLGTAAGFFEYYFSILPKHRTQGEAFHAANDQHFELYGEYRYSSHQSFLCALRHFRAKP